MRFLLEEMRHQGGDDLRVSLEALLLPGLGGYPLTVRREESLVLVHLGEFEHRQWHVQPERHVIVGARCQLQGAERAKQMLPARVWVGDLLPRRPRRLPPHTMLRRRHVWRRGSTHRGTNK